MQAVIKAIKIGFLNSREMERQKLLFLGHFPSHSEVLFRIMDANKEASITNTSVREMRFLRKNEGKQEETKSATQ